MKLKAAAAAVLLGLLCGCGGGGGSGDLSKTEGYSEIIGKEYLTKKALLVSSGGGFRGYLAKPGEGRAPGLDRIGLRFPQEYNDTTYIGLMPTGSRVRITHIYKDWSTLHGSHIEFALKVIEPHEFSSLSFSDVGMIDYRRKPLRLDAELFEEAPPRAEPEKNALPPGTRTAGEWGRQ